MLNKQVQPGTDATTEKCTTGRCGHTSHTSVVSIPRLLPSSSPDLRQRARNKNTGVPPWPVVLVPHSLLRALPSKLTKRNRGFSDTRPSCGEKKKEKRERFVRCLLKSIAAHQRKCIRVKKTERAIHLLPWFCLVPTQINSCASPTNAYGRVKKTEQRALVCGRTPLLFISTSIDDV